MSLSRRHRPLWIGLSILGAVFLVATFIPFHGWDLAAFGSVDPADPYSRVGSDLSGARAFRYAPPMAAILALLGSLTWEAQIALWLSLQLAALWYIGREWALALIVFPPVWLDLVYGNINIFLAAVIVAGFRHPWTWAFALLTKVTPGIGVLWFAVRREWGSLLLVGVGVTTLTVASIIVTGLEPWGEWAALLERSAQVPPPLDAIPIPLLPRLIGAALLVAWGALTNRRWTVAAAATLGMPTLWAIAFAPLVAIAGLNVRPALRTTSARRRTPTEDVEPLSVTRGTAAEGAQD